MDISEKYRRSIAADAIMLGTLTEAVKDKYGEEGLAVLQDAMENKFREVLLPVANKLGVRVNDGSCEDWAKLEGFLAEASGMEYELEVTPEKAILHVKTCPWADQYKRTSQNFCSKVLLGYERALASIINPKLNVSGQHYLPCGDDECSVVCEPYKEVT